VSARFEAWSDATFAEYQAEVARCSAHPTPGADVMVKDALGLAGEVGEVVELIKKARFHGLELDVAKLKNECGDVLWYLADLCAQAGFTLADAAQSNTDKLRVRYPDGFKLGGGVR
jgi:NTP pyrophosphatase (non-canonical NTP hydrolase)